jgi:hypothetical protein
VFSTRVNGKFQIGEEVSLLQDFSGLWLLLPHACAFGRAARSPLTQKCRNVAPLVTVDGNDASNAPFTVTEGFQPVTRMGAPTTAGFEGSLLRHITGRIGSALPSSGPNNNGPVPT